MPVVKCLWCGEDMTLDADVYRDYQGDIRCRQCKALMKIRLTQGKLQATPELKEKGKAHLGP